MYNCNSLKTIPQTDNKNLKMFRQNSTLKFGISLIKDI